MNNSSGEVDVDFYFRRASRSILLAGALLIVPSFVAVSAANAQQQPAAAAKNWKDRDEYDAFTKVQQTTDMKARLDALKAWEDKYPTTDFINERLTYYMDTLSKLAPADQNQRQALLTKCQEALKLDPKNPTAQYFMCFWGPIVGGASPSSDLVGQVESAGKGFVDGADAAFADSLKPPAVSAADWSKAKNFRLGVAHNALAWVAASKKDFATANTEYKQSLTINPEQGATAAQYAKMLYDQKMYPEALFQYARTAQYAGPGTAQSASGRQASLDFFNRAYKNFRGSDEGKDQVLTLAKTNALPPAGFTIVDANAMAQADAKKLEDRMNAEPPFKLWYSIKSNLIGDQGPSFFEKSVKDTEIPAGAQGVKNFEGVVIAVEPADKPTRVTIGVEDPTKADTTLLFSSALPAAALSKIKVGEKLQFGGIADSFTKEPYMLTFKDPEIPGVQLATPAKKPPVRRKK